MRRSILLAAACAIVNIQVAAAADMPTKAPAYAPAPYNWTGFYLGLSAGGIWSSDTVAPAVSGDPGANASKIQAAVAAASLGTSTSSAIFGGQFGYNWQRDQWLWGIETDFSWAPLDGSAVQSVSTTGGATHILTSSVERKLELFGTIRGRVGILMSERFLTYATGGLAYGKLQSSFSVTSPNGGGGAQLPINVSASGPEWRAGWTVGGGFEYALLAGWSAKFEYLHYDLGHQNFSVINTISVSNFMASVNPSFKGDIARVGLNRRF